MSRLAVFGLMQSHQPVAPASFFAAHICANFQTGYIVIAIAGKSYNFRHNFEV